LAKEARIIAIRFLSVKARKRDSPGLT